LSSAPAPRRPGLSKSRYLAGLQCEKRLWLGVHAGELAAPVDAAKQAVFDVGNEVGARAHELFPGGVLVDEDYRDHRAAAARTERLLEDESVPAIFEAAFTHDGVRIRIDVLERLPDGRWGLREVKSTASAKDVHLPDVAVQLHVLEGCGFEVASVELVHIDSSYVRGEDGIEWPRFFARADLTADARAALPEVRAALPRLHATLARGEAPDVAPWRHCHDPYECEFIGHCHRELPDDRILGLRGLREAKAEELRAMGVERIRDIPEDFPLSEIQRRIRAGVIERVPFVADGLEAALDYASLPALYLDFETVAPAIPIWPGTRPFQAIPFQWSLHHQREDGSLEHHEFLAVADGATDPRRHFAESLLFVLEARPDLSILVYSGYERRILRELAEALPDLAPRLRAMCDRLVDLLPIVRAHVYPPEFRGSFSIKSVAPALAPGFGYADLDDVAGGDEAQRAFGRLVRGGLDPAEAERIHEALRAYCQRDTLAMVELHRALVDLATGRNP